MTAKREERRFVSIPEPLYLQMQARARALGVSRARPGAGAVSAVVTRMVDDVTGERP